MTYPPGHIEITLTLHLEVEDEMALRAAAVADSGNANVNSGDAIMKLLRLPAVAERLALPGVRLLGMQITRGSAYQELPSEFPPPEE
jgi:hypothetical protein